MTTEELIAAAKTTAGGEERWARLSLVERAVYVNSEACARGVDPVIRVDAIRVLSEGSGT